MRKLIFALISLMKEEHQHKKALRIFNKQVISTDYIIYLLKKANNPNLRITLRTKEGTTLVFEKIDSSLTPPQPQSKLFTQEKTFEEMYKEYLGQDNQ